MGLTDLKKALKPLDKDQLVALIADLYKKNKAAQEYLDFYVQPNERERFEKYRAKVVEAFFPKRGYQLRLREGKKALSDFQKLEPAAELVADLLLVYVETGVRFTNAYGDIDEGFYSSLETVYAKALALMQREQLLPQFAARTAQIVRDTSGIGWGFHDYLTEVMEEFYPVN
ncbi:DUF6155 family protein [Hymenobacter sp. IS2118]|uniref:DUF6155 family protein n=1 Tax=Hymenobacter sp. IS2118 TaxID=1505605 RepID=UPI00055723B8|nr:DUF6155 family protein [Hymenobacter sp. IS2118]